ncbi:lysine--tRNA ligase [archaeon SCG-AAA382B04]|nr:lysine--tRNA ligase [archaeon SCG-AAA382B04]
MHWSDEKAREAIKQKGRKQTIASGISPSGPIHYGNFREILTADLITRSMQEFETKTKLIWILDDYDPLRKLYPFLEKDFKKHIGKPLSEIPDPKECHDSYSEHFMSDFLESLPKLGIQPEIYKASEMYKNGEYAQATLKALEKTDEIKKIIENITQRDLPKNWLPFNPICKECGKISTTTPTGFEEMEVHYECECGYQGSARIDNGEGKLPWRVDWPARWTILDVTVEPMGKDHAADSGSYDTGGEIAKQIFNKQPPYPIVYEQIGLKGKGEMSSSKGIVLTPKKMSKFLPPEIIRYIITRKKPKRHIDFDTGFGIVQLIDEYQEIEKNYYNGEVKEEEKRTYELSQPTSPSENKPLQIPFKHLVNAVQIARDFEGIKQILARTGHWDFEQDEEELKRWVKRGKNWLRWFAPEKAKFQIKEELPQEVSELNNKQKEFLSHLVQKLEENSFDDEELHQEIYQIFKDLDLGARKAFESIYIAFLGRSSGPRAAWFLLSLDKEFVIKRLRKASNE